MKKEKNEVGFSLQGIKTEQFAIFEENFVLKKEVSFETGLEFKVDQINKQIGVFFEVKFKQGKKLFIKISVSCHFKIKQESWDAFLMDSNILKIEKGFLSHLAMLTIGTTRGVLFAKTEGTQFSKFIIPTLNVNDIITEDAVFSLNTI
jgi:hypothetical protein